MFTAADREFVMTALDQFEANGLVIWSELERNLVVARALVDVSLWKTDDTRPAPKLQPLFLALAGGTDSLTCYLDDVQELYPPLSSMDDDAATEILEQHSSSIFANASSINLVNEDNALEHMVRQFFALAGLDVAHLDLRVMKNGLTRVSFEVEELGACRFEIESLKRPDVTPALAEMNRIAKAKGRGRYIRVSEGSSESETFIFADDATLPRIVDLLGLQAIAPTDEAKL
ncbi:hypothetical protein BRAS3843_1380013 [Bradyrhizobium sp. STM 3843]|uniref:hypothetical protein n=1 Tax=Bradyrhizobium sp. STM 3843 TaxID=551947 RepID=UPI000240AA7F|nr:hypothetical protein [Bradyrhizobium sp. STM 3843]CCE05393.1 hypothetical protein BRAS3843_1380013 [Bradyrhizobium sp. STM 3843]